MRQEWIEDLLAVLDTGSITAASERRFVTQSAFTRRLRAIEAALGTTLLDRRRRPARLLPHVAGREAQMRDAVARLNALASALGEPDGRDERRVSIACQHTIATTLAPTLVRELMRTGTVSVRVRESDRADCLMMLLKGDVDFGVVFETPEEALEGAQAFLGERIGRDRMVPVIARGHAATFEAALASRTLPVIGYPREAHFGRLFETRFVAGIAPGIEVERTAETGLSLAALHYALEGIGVGWLPRSVAADALADGRLVDLSTRLPQQELHVKIVRLQRAMSPLAERAWNRIATAYRRGGSPQAAGDRSAGA